MVELSHPLSTHLMLPEKLALLATVVVVAYVAKCFYKRVVITIYYLITIRLISN